ncbi:MAG: redoxin domain-containing protein [Opitutales bacterium]
MKKVLQFTGLAAALVAFTTSLHADAPKVGEKAPAFTLTSSVGNEHSLSDFEGKFVVLEWTNHGCPFVKKHYESGNMQATQKAVLGHDAVWLSICSSAPGKQGHMKPEDINAKLKALGAEATAYLIDEDGTVGKSYNATRTPEIFIINPEGVLVYHGAIDSIPSARPSDVEKATNFVMAAFKSIGKGEAIAQSVTQAYGCSVKY